MQHILSEIVMGGMVLETNMNEIVSKYMEQDKIEKSEVRATIKSSILSFLVRYISNWDF